MSVLAIDEESEILSRIADILGEAGYTCQCAARCRFRAKSNLASPARSDHCQREPRRPQRPFGLRRAQGAGRHLRRAGDVSFGGASARRGSPAAAQRRRGLFPAQAVQRQRAGATGREVAAAQSAAAARGRLAGSPQCRAAQIGFAAPALFARPSCRPSRAHGDRRFLPPGDRAHPPRGISAVRSLGFDAPTTRPIMALARRLAATARRAQGLQQSFNSRAIFLRGARSWKH